MHRTIEKGGNLHLHIQNVFFGLQYSTKLVSAIGNIPTAGICQNELWMLVMAMIVCMHFSRITVAMLFTSGVF